MLLKIAHILEGEKAVVTKPTQLIGRAILTRYPDHASLGCTIDILDTMRH
jgi:hypothetical protein